MATTQERGHGLNPVPGQKTRQRVEEVARTLRRKRIPAGALYLDIDHLCGSDVGGFLDNATGELLARWTQMAAFTPFFRNHSSAGTHHQGPWAFGPEIEAICWRYIEMRYQLLPYLYALFVEAHRRGTPVMRPLAWDYQNDPVAVACSDQFLLGPHLLVAPILRAGAGLSTAPPRWRTARQREQRHLRERSQNLARDCARHPPGTTASP